MTSVMHFKSYERRGGGAVGAGAPVEKRRRSRHRARQAARNWAILRHATRNLLLGTSAADIIVKQVPGDVVGGGQMGNVE